MFDAFSQLNAETLQCGAIRMGQLGGSRGVLNAPLIGLVRLPVSWMTYEKVLFIENEDKNRRASDRKEQGLHRGREIEFNA
jgi:hypothetical protein